MPTPSVSAAVRQFVFRVIQCIPWSSFRKISGNSCSFVAKIGDTLDKNGAVMDNFGYVLDNVGNVSAHVGNEIRLKNRISNTKTKILPIFPPEKNYFGYSMHHAKR